MKHHLGRAGFILHFVACFLVVSSGIAAPQSTLGEEPPPALSVGLMVALSGSFAVVGEGCRLGFEVARELYAPGDMIGGRRVRFIYGDTKGEIGAGVSEYKRLVESEGVSAVIMHKSSIAAALNPLSVRGKLPLLGVAGYERFCPDNPYAFRFWPSTLDEADALVRSFSLKRLQRLALVTLEDEYALSLRRDVLKEMHGRVAPVFDQTLTSAEMDFHSSVLRIRSARADAVLVNLGVEQNGIFVKQLRGIGFAGQIYGNYWFINSDVISTAGPGMLEGALVFQSDLDQPKFVAALEQRAPDSKPVAVTYTCYVAAAALIQALANDGKINNAAGLYQALGSLKEIKLPDGRVPMVQREAVFKMKGYVFRGGEFQAP